MREAHNSKFTTQNSKLLNGNISYKGAPVYAGYLAPRASA